MGQKGRIDNVAVMIMQREYAYTIRIRLNEIGAYEVMVLCCMYEVYSTKNRKIVKSRSFFIYPLFFLQQNVVTIDYNK